MRSVKTYRDGDYIAVHEAPVWRDRSNFMIRADIAPDSESGEWEQLWARQLDTHRFEICCIPFFVYDLALGDEVETDEAYVVRQVVRDAGHYTFRIWFGDSAQPSAYTAQVVSALEGLGCLVEWSSNNLLAADASGAHVARAAADFLQDEERSGRLRYETGRTR